MAKRRTSILVDETLLRKARKLFKAATNTETITRALEHAVHNHEAEAAARDLIRKGRGRFADVYR